MQTRSGVKIAKDLIDMSVRALKDTEYVDLMGKIKVGPDLSTLPENDSSREYAAVWKDLRLIKVRDNFLVYKENLLVPPKGEKKG